MIRVLPVRFAENPSWESTPFRVWETLGFSSIYPNVNVNAIKPDEDFISITCVP